MSRGPSCAISCRLQRSRHLRSHVLLACAIFLLSNHCVHAQTAFEDVSSQVSVTRSGLVFNRVTNTFDCLIQVTNASTATLPGPLVLSVSSISTTNVTLFNPAGQDASGNHYINLAVPTGGLAPGKTIANSLLKFKNPIRVAFTFSIAVLSQAPSTNAGTTILDATGGRISVPDPDNPNAIVTIVIPPGVLGIASDTISVSFSSTSPGPLSAKGIAVGGHFVSRVVVLSRASGLKFLFPIQVTIPYDLSKLGPNDSMLVFYWDINQNEYDVVATTGIDSTNGTITFQTVHFSQYQVVAFPISIGPSGLPNNPLDLNGDTLFRAADDGFPIMNFDTITGDATGGACFGLTAFAKWYYQKQFLSGQAPELAKNRIFNNQPPGVNSSQLYASEDDVDRELIYWSYSQTLPENRQTSWLDRQVKSDFDTANSLFLSLLVLNRPQLITLAKNGSRTAPTDFHSILVYSYAIDLVHYVVHFGFYDPNVPGQEQVLDYSIDAKSFALPAYTDAFGTHYSFAYFNALSSFMAPTDFLTAYIAASNGWPNHHFDEIQVDEAKSTGLTLVSEQGPDPVTSPVEYQVLPGSTTLAMNWRCSCLPTDPPIDPPISVVYAHVFINGTFKQDIAIRPTQGTPTPIAYTIPADVTLSTEPEMIIIISDFPNGPQWGTVQGIDPINYLLTAGYEGFLRIILKPPLYQFIEASLGGRADTSFKPYGSPYQEVVDELQEHCYTPANLLSIDPHYYPMQSSLIPFSAVFPLVCVGWEPVVQLGVAPILNPPIFTGTFNSALAEPNGSATASSTLNFQYTPTSITVTANASIASNGTEHPVPSASSGANLTLVVPSQAHYQVTAQVSPTSTGACGLIVAGMSVRDPNNPGGTLQNNTAYAGSQFPPYANPSVSFAGSFPSSYNTVDIGVGVSCTVGSSNGTPPVQVSVTMTLTP
jgi:hypothetical protein